MEDFLLILAAMVCARTCAMSFNRIADREFDRANPRTAGRHLPKGEIYAGGGVGAMFDSGGGSGRGELLINPVCCDLSPVALVVVCFYSLTKRFTDFSHVFLGLALALAPIGAWLAVKGNFHFFPDGAAERWKTARCCRCCWRRRWFSGWWVLTLFTRCRIMSLTGRTDCIRWWCGGV